VRRFLISGFVDYNAIKNRGTLECSLRHPDSGLLRKQHIGTAQKIAQVKSLSLIDFLLALK